MAEIPRIRSVFEIFDPIILPNAIPELPFMLASILTTNSGAEVPKATIVRPITKEEMPYFRAIEDDPSIITSAPLIKNTKPKINNIIVKYIYKNLFL